MAASKAPSAHQVFWRRGEPFVWICGSAVAVIMLLILTLLGNILTQGASAFWPDTLLEYTLEDGSKILGQIVTDNVTGVDGKNKTQFKVGNREILGADFRWIDSKDAVQRRRPKDALVVERTEFGNFHGYLKTISAPMYYYGQNPTHTNLENVWKRILTDMERLRTFEDEIAAINRKIDSLNRKVAKRRFAGETPPYVESEKIEKLRQATEELLTKQSELETLFMSNKATFVTAEGGEKEIPIPHIVRFYAPNQMTNWEKLTYYGDRVHELLTAPPRESNTEGGLMPAIFGTVFAVFLMSILSFPLGVLAGIFLREYAKDGIFVRIVRIAVNNLAGIPSIVYGIFGLGFFVYGLGASIDRTFFAQHLPEPTLGTGGILWASLTLGILTIPVVIVATEEAFGAIPRAVRESSLALGATKFQTLIRVQLPLASPGIMTGFILAMARAAGEVAPLMITGVVKMAPSLPFDAAFPFIHLDRKFMHLGFHIYDISTQSPNVEAAKPMVYVTTLLLIVVVITMSSTAIWLRGRMRRKFDMKGAI